MRIQKQNDEDPKEFWKKFSTEIKKEHSVERLEEDVNGHADARRPSIVTAIAGGSPGLVRGPTSSDIQSTPVNGIADGVNENDGAADSEDEKEEEDPLPPGFPQEDEFDHFLCYKCVENNPWIKRYAGTPGFLPPVYHDAELNTAQANATAMPAPTYKNGVSKKRKANDNDEESSTTTSMGPPKRQRSEDPTTTLSSIPETTLAITPKKQDSNVCKLDTLPSTSQSSTPFSLFLKPDFRDHLCHCASCFPLIKPYPQLLEEEETYEPPISEDGDNDGAASVGTGSLLDRGEAAFNNMDRVRAIQGAMAYAHLKDNLKSFFQPFAESGKAVGAEDIKAYFEKLRGDEQGIKDAAGSAARSKKDEDDADPSADNRKEQSGY